MKTGFFPICHLHCESWIALYINNPFILNDFIYIFHQQFVYIFQVTPEELRSLIGKYADTSLLAQNGVTIGGKKYMYLSSTDKVIRAKKGTSGVHAIKTTQSNYIFLFPFTQKKQLFVIMFDIEKCEMFLFQNMGNIEDLGWIISSSISLLFPKVYYLPS